MRKKTLFVIKVLIVLVASCVEAHAAEPQATAQGSSITPPKGIVSLTESAAALALISGNSHVPGLTFVSAYMDRSDVAKIEHGQRPEMKRLLVVFQPTDTRFRRVDASAFKMMVEHLRNHFLNDKIVSGANSEFKAQGIDAMVSPQKGERILVDNPNCFAVVKLASYNTKSGTKMPAMDLGDAYLRIKGQLWVINIFVRADSRAGVVWLTDYVPRWLMSLTKNN